MSIVCQSGSFCPRHQRVVNGRRWMARLTLASEGWPRLVSPLAAQQALQSCQSDNCWFKSRQFYFNSKTVWMRNLGSFLLLLLADSTENVTKLSMTKLVPCIFGNQQLSRVASLTVVSSKVASFTFTQKLSGWEIMTLSIRLLNRNHASEFC